MLTSRSPGDLDAVDQEDLLLMAAEPLGASQPAVFAFFVFFFGGGGQKQESLSGQF